MMPPYSPARSILDSHALMLALLRPYGGYQLLKHDTLYFTITPYMIGYIFVIVRYCFETVIHLNEC